jgi:hypothetical protein
MKKRTIADMRASSASMSSVEVIKLKDLDSLLKNSRPMVTSNKDAPQTDYSDKDKALSMVDDGYARLPGIYKEVFLDPIKNVLNTQEYAAILESLDTVDGQSGHGPWHDWLASINERIINFQSDATKAFEEALADLYDGFLSMEEGKRIKPPDHETVSPLSVWGFPTDGPYTWPSDVGVSLGMKMSTVNLPPAYSKNIALWSSIGHETGGHDILHAYNGMLDELGSKVAAKLVELENDPALKGASAIVNGRQESIAVYAGSYWKDRIDETASDVCGLLNIGPAAGISLAVLLISLRGGKLVTVDSSDDVHPIDALRIFLAADVIRNTKELDINTANTWADTFESIADKYIENKSEFHLVSQTLDGQWHVDVAMPHKQMRETTKTVAESIANSTLLTLGGHALSDVNTWANTDEVLTTRITNNFLDGTEPRLDPGPDGQKVYAAHILAGATIALAKLADISRTTDLAIKSLNKLYAQNPVWHGLPIRFRSQMSKHNMVPSYGEEMPEDLRMHKVRRSSLPSKSRDRRPHHKV